MIREFFTVSKSAEAIYEEKKSRFIAQVKPIINESDAVEYIEEIRSKYWDATHNVYAYDIMEEALTQRFSDDGEPQGTAGLPIIELIKKMNIHNVIVIVTRYFGGTMLGAAGLIRAYGKASSMAIEAAKVVKKMLCAKINVLVDYSISGKIQNFAINNGYNIINTRYFQDVEFEFVIPIVNEEVFIKKIVDLTNDKALINVEGSQYLIFDRNGTLIKE
jgi:uncharacterized YigZ family protein